MKRAGHPAASLPTSRRERIYLTGFMGSGKSTIGPILANSIGYEFADVDKTIERTTGKSVNEIFLESGEQQFRALERGIIASLSARPHLVVSLGGGTIMDAENFRLITASGILVFLKSTPEEIFQRVRRRDDRPVLRDETGERLEEDRLRERITALYTLREPVYSRADITVHTGDRRVGLTVDELVRILMPHIG
jgi:shikimate kinase